MLISPAPRTRRTASATSETIRNPLNLVRSRLGVAAAVRSALEETRVRRHEAGLDLAATRQEDGRIRAVVLLSDGEDLGDAAAADRSRLADTCGVPGRC